MCKKYQDYIPDRELSDNGETLMNSDNNEIVVGIFNNDVLTVVHEATHAALFILKTHYMNPNDSDGESLSYLLTYLYEIIVKRMNNVKY